MTPAQKRYRRALRAYNQPHDLNSLIEARKALEAAERALEEERAKAVAAPVFVGWDLGASPSQTWETLYHRIAGPLFHRRIP